MIVLSFLLIELNFFLSGLLACLVEHSILTNIIDLPALTHYMRTELDDDITVFSRVAKLTNLITFLQQKLTISELT